MAVFGIRSKPTPRRVRLRWAAGTAVAGPFLLLAREGRFDGWFSPLAYVASAAAAGVIGYFGSSWERRG
jgi:hypothetical protein